MMFLTSARLSERLSKTPEGYLLCEDVAVARIGSMSYAPSELTPPPETDLAVIELTRGSDDLFDPTTLASADGKPVTLGHPPVDVTAETWKEYAVGFGSNPRASDDYAELMMDLLITDQAAIDAVLVDGVREISLGSDAEPEMLAPGVYRLRNVRVNHIAIVPRGRSGPDVAIKDEQPDAELVADPAQVQAAEQIVAAATPSLMERVVRLIDSLAGERSDGDAKQIRIERDELLTRITDADDRCVKLEAELTAARETITLRDESIAQLQAEVKQLGEQVDATLLVTEPVVPEPATRKIQDAAPAKQTANVDLQAIWSAQTAK